MKKIIFILTGIIVVLVITSLYSPVIAAPIIDECQTDRDCPPNSRCLRDAAGSLKCTSPTPDLIEKTFGKIEPPKALKGLVSKDPTGAGGISQFLSNFVSLIYIAATIVLVLMLLWGAWDWITSEGDKEKLQSAQRKIINAFIGIMLFAAAFAIIQVVGQFTGFKFFVGQNP